MHESFIRMSEVAARHHGVVSATQARSAGATRLQIHRWVERGLLERVGSRSVAFVGQPKTWTMMLQAALNDGGPLAVVSNRSAACLHSFDSFVEGPVHVTVPTAHRHRSLTGAVVHLCAPLRPGDWTLLRGLRCTSPVRTIFDLAGCCSRVELENAIDSAVRNGGISLDYLSRQLQGVRRSGLSGVRILEEVLVDPGGTNGLECRFLKLCRQALLPKPACQVTHKRGSDLTIRPARSESN